MARQLRVSTSLTATPNQRRDQATNETEVTSAYSHEVVNLPCGWGPCRFCVYNFCGTLAKPVLASLVAVLLLIYMCSFGRRGTKRLHYVGRNLSDDEAASQRESGICGEVGDEADTSSSSEKEAATLPLPELLAPSVARTPKRAFGEDEGDEKEAGPPRLPLPFKKRRFIFATPPVPPSQPLAAEGVQQVQHPPFPAGPTKPSAQRLPGAVSGEGAGDSSAGAKPLARLSKELDAADALLLLQQSPQISRSFGEETKQHMEEDPQPSTSSAGLPPFPSRAAFSKEELGESHDAHDTAHLAPAPSGQEGQPQEAGPAGAPARLPAAPSSGRLGLPVEVPPNHSFFRLPRLEAGVTLRPLNLNRALATGLASYRPLPIMREARRLFAKESLSQEEANALAGQIEELLAHIYYYQRDDVDQKNVTNAVEKLGHRLLLLDAVVSYYQVAGHPRPPPWWDKFTNLIPHVYVGRLYGGSGPAPVNYRDFAFALSEALVTLKSGIRPPNDVLYRLKYRLLCSEKLLKKFRSKGFEPWRAECPDTGGST